MSSTTSRSAALISLSLSYILVVLLCTPFVASARTLSKPAASTQEQSLAPYRDGEILVRFRDGVSAKDKETILANHGLRRKQQLEGDSGVEKLELPTGKNAKTAVMQILLNPQVQFAEPNFLISKEDLTPNDPQFNQQWALQNIGQNGGQFGSDIKASAAWDKTTGAASTVIAVIDSGIDFTHPDLTINQWTNPLPSAKGDLHGWDFVNNSTDITDEQGHGTAVAGIIAAEGNNSVGITGVMWRASLMSLRVLDNTGTGDIANAVQAIDYAVNHGAQVINLSWGTSGESLALKDAIQRALRRNVVVVCSAGNGGKDLDTNAYFPASFGLKGVITVAGTDNFDQPASWSNYGARTVTVAAPGTDILTTQIGGEYRTVTGTSAAAPVVTGIAGLLKTSLPGANATQVARAIADSARKIASLSGKVSSGGVASAADALAKVHGSPNQSPTLPPRGIGSGGTGPGGTFSTTPPPSTNDSTLTNMPNLDEVRTSQPQEPKTKAPIEANLMCADCDPYGGGGGGSFYPSGDPNFSTARRRPRNETGQPGVDLGSQNFNWSLPLVSLPGRAGLDLNLTLTYNSLVWTKDGSYMKFNADLGTPAPGFRLGLPMLQQRFLNSQTGIYAYMMVTPSGGRVELRQVGTSNIYEAVDGSYTQLDATNSSAPIVRMTNGTQLTFMPVTVNSEFRCTQIKDRNGNYISATYNTTTGHLLTITDTLGRVITFVYDAGDNLSSIRQTWAGVTHDWATFYYGQVYVAPGFGGGLVINGANNNYTTVLTQVNLHDGSYYTFNYNNSFAQVFRINRYAADNHLLNYTNYNLNTSAGQTECPRFTEKREWAENWNNHVEVVTTYAVATDNSWSQQTAPDGTIYKELYYTSGWQTGLPYQTEVWSGGVRKKYTTTTWTQDNTGLTYAVNPRPIETNIYDDAGNRRRTTITYTSYNLPNPVALPTEVKEYAADAVTVLRRTTTTYFDAGANQQAYIDRRVLGLVREVIVYDGANQPLSRTWYDYDWGDPAYWAALPAAATQHDASGTSYGRGNLCWVGRWDVTDFNNSTKVLNSYTKYNRTGSVIKTEDAYGQGTAISYTDAFSDAVNRNTFAYPTTMTDAENYSSTVQYNYDFGAVTRTQDPKGAVQTITYDSAARRTRITNQTTGAYTRFEYATANTFIAAFNTIEAGQGEAFEGTAFDGMGRYRATQIDHPGSVGGYSTTITSYDVMGREKDRSNPTEMTASWIASGDDASTGFLWTTQTYDWDGRPLVTTRPDGFTRGNTYGGCGCAGGEQTTERDEQGRRKRYTTDVLGRMIKTEELTWDQTVYSTTNYTYNVRDQLTNINQAGQTRSFTYDGYGRIATRTTPEQGTTTFTHYNNDLLQTVTDARGAIATYLYNGRHMVTNINFTVSGSVAATPNVTYGYDSAGNRTSMTDGLGSISYVYNTASQMTSETRTFNGLAGSFTLSYGYNLAGQLNSITNPWNAQVGYSHDKIGRAASVSGSGYASVTSYVSSMAYRAFGPKQISYANGRTLTMQYDNRLRLTDWSTPSVLRMQYNYTWEHDGRVGFARNLDDETLDRYYGYDHVGRITVSRSGNEARLAINEQVPLIQNGPYSHGYQYDQFGNITFREGWGGTNPSYTVSYTNNKMNGMTYDAAGNLIDAGGGWTFTYDATGQQVTSAVSSVTNVYDGERLRGKKTEGGTTFYYLRSSMLGGQIVAEIAANGDWARGFVYLGGELLAVQQAGVYWVHQDPVVKSKRLTNSSGTVVSSVELDPWGGETNRSSNEGFQPKKFGSYFRDGIGSDDAMHRRYNRWWTRFEQADPYDGSYDLKDPQSFNRFAYVKNDPVNFVDPSGLLNWPIDIGNVGSVTVYSGPSAIDDFFLRSILGSLFGGSGPTFRQPLRPEPREPQGGPRPIAPRAQPQSQTVKTNPQQQGFNDCARAAYRAYRKTYLRTSGLAIVGGAGLGVGISTMIGIRGVGFGIRGVIHAAGDTAVPLFGRILTTLSEAKDSGVIATGFNLIGGGIAQKAIREADENSRRTEARIKDCESKFPNANHSLSFLNF